ncbi:MAG: TldD/PmbA family protein [Zetaproteobacteria bacterium]|nr:MAG: TldD/PmbA family protein [Zetaproteobacteria bacterium]
MMHTPKEHAIMAVELAMRLGADAADAVSIDDQETNVTARKGRIEAIEQQRQHGVGLRVFVETRHGPAFATASTSDLSEAGLRTLAEQTLAMARISEPDPDAIPPVGAEHPSADALRAWRARHPLADNPWTMEQAREAALACEAHALAYDSRITNSEGAHAAFGTTRTGYAASDGFAAGDARASVSLSISLVAGSGDAMQRDHAWHQAASQESLRKPEALAEEAAERALKRLGATEMASGRYPVVFEPRVASSLLGHLLGAINGRAVLQQRSFLAESLHRRIFPEMVHIIDDPDHAQGLGNRLFDGEGTRCRRCTLVEHGELRTFLVDRYAAKRLHLPALGHARRGLTGDISVGTSNLICQPGNRTPEAIIGDIERGLLVTELIGFGVNPVTGDYSRGAAGFLIEQGQIRRPVQGITIAGNLATMFAELAELGNDLTWFGTSAVPTIALKHMTVAGQTRSGNDA